MEDKPSRSVEHQEDAKDEKEPKDSFAESWLKFLSGPNAKPEQEETEESEEDEETEEDKSPARNNFKKLGRAIKDLVFPSAEKRDATDKEPLQQESPVQLTPYKADTATEDEASSSLEIDHEVESIAEPSSTSKEVQPEELATATHPGPEHIGQIAHRVETPAIAAINEVEQKRYRQETKTKRRIIRLKRAAKTLKKEQQELKERQEEFEKQLDKKIKQDEKAKKEQHLDIERLAKKPQAEIAKSIENILVEQDLKEMLTARPADKPEVVLERVEVAAAHNLPIESLYERRHELKDASTDDVKGTYATTYKSAGVNKAAGQNKREPLQETVISPEPNFRKVHHAEAKPPQPALYKQAVVSGFWTAIALLAGIMTLVLLS